MANTWNESGTTWGQNSWGSQGPLTITLTGQSATSSLGSVGLTFGVSTEPITGLQAATGLGSLTLSVVTDVALTGLQAQSELGTFDNAGTLVGWGRNGWGEEPYGDSFNSLVQPAGISATSSVGSITTFDTVTVIPTGVSSTSAVGSLGFSISPIVIPTGQSATSNVGDFDPAAETVGLTGLGMTSIVGLLQPELVQIPTGVQAATSVGSLNFVLTSVITPSGQSATSAVGSLVPEIGVPLTGLQSTSAVGAISPSDVMGLTGVQATTELNDNLILKYFGKITPKDSTGYTTKTPKNSTGYTTKTA